MSKSNAISSVDPTLYRGTFKIYITQRNGFMGSIEEKSIHEDCLDRAFGSIDFEVEVIWREGPEFKVSVEQPQEGNRGDIFSDADKMATMVLNNTSRCLGEARRYANSPELGEFRRRD